MSDMNTVQKGMKWGVALACVLELAVVRYGVCQERTPTVEKNAFVMAMIRPETQYYGKLQRMIYIEIFRRLGMKIEFRDYPGKRAAVEADAGNVDGEGGRIAAYAADHPNLLRVEEALLSPNYSAFAAQASIPELTGWESLKGSAYLIAYQRGILIFENNLPKFVEQDRLSIVNETAQGLKKLVNGRTDIFMDEETSVLSLLHTPEFEGKNIRKVGVMDTAPVYPYLHKKHAALVPRMAEAIRAMKAEGLIEQYRLQVEEAFGFAKK